MGRCRRTVDADRRCDDSTAWGNANLQSLPDANTDRYQPRLRLRRDGDEDVMQSRHQEPLDPVQEAAARCTAKENTAAGNRQQCQRRRSATLYEDANH